MYDLYYYDARTRERLAGGDRRESLPAAERMPSGQLAEAIHVNDARQNMHWDGNQWRDGLLPGRKPRRDAAPGAW